MHRRRNCTYAPKPKRPLLVRAPKDALASFTETAARQRLAQGPLGPDREARTSDLLAGGDGAVLMAISITMIGDVLSGKSKTRASRRAEICAWAR
jgi:hypothetical protein